MADGINDLKAVASATATVDSELVGQVRPVVHFNVFYALGIAFSVTAVPLSVGSYLSLVIGLGGAPMYLYTFIFVAVFQVIVCLAVAELASGLPHSSGPAYWVKVLSPPKYEVLNEYLIGWWTNVAWLCICAASNLYAAEYVTALAAAVNADYVPTAWQTYLVSCAISLVALFLNLPGGFKLMPLLLGSCAITINATALFLLVSLLVRTDPKAPATEVFTVFVNASGWDSLGTVFFIAILPAVASLSTFDTAIHLTDEMDKPSKQVPQVMLGSLALGIVTGIAMIIVYEFCNTDPLSLLDSVGGMPLVQLLLNAYDSTPLLIAATTFIIIVLTFATTNCLTSWSRLYWSFSRERMLPLHAWTSRLSGAESLPVNALVMNTILADALTAISCGNSTAMNAILGGASLFSLGALVLSFALLLYQGRDRLDPDRWLNLGKWGGAVHGVSIVWCVFVAVWLCFPSYLPVTPASMNYTVVVFCGFTVVAGGYWVWGYARGNIG